MVARRDKVHLRNPVLADRHDHIGDPAGPPAQGSLGGPNPGSCLLQGLAERHHPCPLSRRRSFRSPAVRPVPWPRWRGAPAVLLGSSKSRSGGVSNVRIVSLPGRTFLEATLGASLVLNPNDNWCKLYPAEVKQLLGGANLVDLEKVDFGGKEFIWRPASRIPDGLVEHLVISFQLLESLDSAYLVEMAPADHPDRIEVVVALRSPAFVKDLLVRTVLTDLQFRFPAPEVPLAVVSIDSAKPLPEWVEALGLSPLYKRESSA